MSSQIGVVPKGLTGRYSSSSAFSTSFVLMFVPFSCPIRLAFRAFLPRATSLSVTVVHRFILQRQEQTVLLEERRIFRSRAPTFLLTRRSGTSASCRRCCAYRSQSECPAGRCRCRRSGRPGSCGRGCPPPRGEPGGCSGAARRSRQQRVNNRMRRKASVLSCTEKLTSW